MKKYSDLLIIAKDKQIYPINENIQKYSPKIDKILKESNNEQPITLDLTSQQILLLSQYFTLRNFEIPFNFIAEKPLKTKDFSKSLLKQDYEIFKSWSQDDVDELLKASIYLEIKSLNEILLTIVASEFVFKMEDDAELKYRMKLGIKQDEISQTTINLIKNEFKWAFP